jgi:signal recognition particle receptor subunit beta
MPTAAKIIVTGTYNTGKSQFIKTMSEIPPVYTDAANPHIQVAMDFGRLTIDNDLLLYLFGTSSHRRLDYVWDIFQEGMVGFVIMVDSSRPETFREAKSICTLVELYSPFPYVIAANKQDSPDAWDVDDLRIALRIPADIPIVPCVATEQEGVKRVLLALLDHVLLALDEETEEELWLPEPG